VLTGGGLIRFGAVVANVAALAAITTDGPGSVLFDGPLVRTSGNQTYNETALTLGANPVFNATGNGAVSFAAAPNGARSLSVETGGDVIFNGFRVGQRG
jgi:hypothetical protein